MLTLTRLQILADNLAESTFKLRYPINVHINKSKKYRGVYNNTLILGADEHISIRHDIKVSTFMNVIQKEMNETIVHELVHAWQEENNKRVAHGKSFKKWVKFFAKQNIRID